MVVDKKPSASSPAKASGTSPGGGASKKPQPNPLIPASKSVVADKKKPLATKSPMGAPKVDEQSKKSSEEDEKKPEQNDDPTVQKKKKIVIPFVLPWESRPSLQNQSGMGAFGTKIEVFKTKGGPTVPADKPLQSESVLTLFMETNKYSSQSGMHAFGAHRDNVIKFENLGKQIDEEKSRACNSIIPKQSGSNEAPTQSGQTPIGSIRQQIMKIEYRPDMKIRMEKKSESMLTKLGTPNPNCHAGTAVYDKFRKQVPDIAIGLKMKKGHDRRTESVLPRFAQMKDLPIPAPITGAGISGLGPFRQVVTPVTGGYQLNSDEITASKKIVPWAMQGLLSSQQGTGGFQHRRDVVSPVTEAIKAEVTTHRASNE